MSEEDALQRGRRWAAFYEEEQGLSDMLDLIGSTYIRRMSAVEPWETDKLTKLAMANKITDQLRGLVKEIIVSGEIAAAAKRHADKIEQLPMRKRRLLGLTTGDY